MACCNCEGVEQEFDATVARRQLRKFRRRGAKRTTRWLIDAIVSQGARGRTLLDIGGGVGEIQHELAGVGVDAITNVDASSAYQQQARNEASERGYADTVSYVYGDIVDVASQIAPSDIVTLDRVICCYSDVDALIDTSASKARQLYGVVYPRTTWWTSVGFRVINWVQAIRRAAFRAFLHSSARVEDLLASKGFGRIYHRTNIVWQVSLYERLQPPSGPYPE